jgi:hypothetical protein
MTDTVRRIDGETNAQWLARLREQLAVHLDRVAGKAWGASAQEKQLRGVIDSLERGVIPEGHQSP